MTENTNRLIWACRRGMLELDLLLLPFCQQQYPLLNAIEQQTFQELLTAEDQQLYQWLVSKEQIPPSHFAAIIETIIHYARFTHSH